MSSTATTNGVTYQSGGIWVYGPTRELPFLSICPHYLIRSPRVDAGEINWRTCHECCAGTTGSVLGDPLLGSSHGFSGLCGTYQGQHGDNLVADNFDCLGRRFSYSALAMMMSLHWAIFGTLGNSLAQVPPVVAPPTECATW